MTFLSAVEELLITFKGSSRTIFGCIYWLPGSLILYLSSFFMMLLGEAIRTIFTSLSYDVLSNCTLELSDFSLLKDEPFQFQIL